MTTRATLTTSKHTRPPSPSADLISDSEPPLSRADLADLAEGLGRHLTPLAELAHLIARPLAVWERPSDVIATTNGTIVFAELQPRELVAASLDRVRVTVTNHDAAEPLWLCSYTDALAQTQRAFQLPAGASITIETRSRLCAFVVAANVNYSTLAESLNV
jgi:hypothetical protein